MSRELGVVLSEEEMLKKFYLFQSPSILLRVPMSSNKQNSYIVTFPILFLIYILNKFILCKQTFIYLLIFIDYAVKLKTKDDI